MIFSTIDLGIHLRLRLCALTEAMPDDERPKVLELMARLHQALSAEGRVHRCVIWMLFNDFDDCPRIFYDFG